MWEHSGNIYNAVAVVVKGSNQLFLPFADASPRECVEEITLMTLYEDGFRGKENSEEKRKALLRALDLPDNLSAKAAVMAINLFGGRKFYDNGLKKLKQ